MRRLLLYAGVAAASAAVQLTDIYGGELHMRHFQSRMVKDARETGVIVLTLTAYNYARAFANFKYMVKNISTATPAVLACARVKSSVRADGDDHNKAPRRHMTTRPSARSTRWAWRQCWSTNRSAGLAIASLSS